MITGMFHLALRTANVAATVAFYEKVVGLREVARPPGLKFPGAWLALPNDPKAAIIHLYAGVAAVAEGETVPQNNHQGIADHLCLSAIGAANVIAVLNEYAIPWRAQDSNPNNFQLFFYDPNGLKLELSFKPAVEQNLPPSLTPEQTYRANERFFELSDYVRFLDA
jgi:catechol 2,3-dioxygenase-like lactoylglutathione lyase family enzyme